MSFINNTYYNITHRHPNIHTDGRADVINNVIFNWKYRLTRTGGDIKLNHIGNYYALGCLNSIDAVGFQVSDSNGYIPSIFTDNNYIDKDILTSELVNDGRMVK